MAKETESGAEKSEDPTGRRITESRREGQIGKSTDLGLVAGMTASVIGLQLLGPAIWQDLIVLFEASFQSQFSTQPITTSVLQKQFNLLILHMMPEVLLLMAIAAVAGFLTMGLQTKFNISKKLLKPKFSQLNPIKGLKRLASSQNFVQVGKSLAKLFIICPVAYFAFMDLFPEFVALMDVPLTDLLPYTAYAAMYIFWRIIGLLLILALLDLIYQKWNNHRQIKMSKQEVKEEQKSIEGDEQTKRRIRSQGLQRIRERMMDAVRSADVVVTNPTHLSVALKYEIGPGNAPKVVAKGRGHMALRIRELARENGVPVIERKPLARALFKGVEVGQTIPYELYQAVADLLAYVYRIKGKRIKTNATQPRR